MNSNKNRRKKILYVSIPLLLFLVILSALINNANKLLKYQLQQFLGNGFSVEDISLRWDGVEAKNIKVIRTDEKKTFSADKIKMNASFIGLLKQENIISGIELDRPFVLLEVDRKGKMLLPLPLPQDKKTEEQKTDKYKSKPFLIKKLSIRDGSLDYRDNKISTPPALIKLTDIYAETKNLSIPPDSITSGYSVMATVPGKASKGTITSDGTINISTKDTKSRLIIKDLDIVQLRPYYDKKGDVEVTKGLLSVDAKITIIKAKIHSTGKIIIKDLEFKTSSGKFMGLPLLAVTKLMKDSNNQITLDFLIEGDINNPKFSIMDTLLQKLSLSLAKTLGLPVEAIGKSVFDVGGSVLKKLFK